MTLFPGKISIFAPKISDDLLFGHRPGFLIFRIFTVFNVEYDPFFTRKTAISEKNSWITPFSTLLTTLLLEILGGRMHGLSPHLKRWGDRPTVPPRSPPLTTDDLKT